MSLEDDSARLAVSVYLLKKAMELEALVVIEGESVSRDPLKGELEGGAFFTLPSEPNTPKWLQPISTLVASGQPLDIAGQSPGAILWAPRGGRSFLFTFGYGHTKIRQEWLEPDFGKVVALAVVPQNQVKEVRAEQVFARRHIASERAPQASAVREFGFEPDRDLVTSVEGTPEPTYWPLLGRKVRGGTSFKFDLDVGQIEKALDRLSERFDSNEHKTRWPQASNLVPVRDSVISSALDAELDALLSKPNAGQLISLTAPGERSGDKPYPHHFVIGRMTANPVTSPYLSLAGWESYAKKKGVSLDLSAAMGTRVHLLDENKEEIDSCRIYECLAAEVSHGGATHVLSSGTWYAADLKFIASTNAVIGALNAPPHALPMWNATDDEGVYNESASSTDPSLWLFDKELVSFGGGQSRFEFCDLMHFPTRTLYFVKHPSGSASVSHLSEQVRRTAETFFSMDPAYRLKLKQRVTKMKKTWDVSWLASQPKRHEWNLCLVLMGKHATKLPFFAKCGIARLVGELNRGGYSVAFQAV